MTSLMTSIVAIVLFGMMLTATVSYADSLGFMSSTDSAQLADHLYSAAALVAQIQHDTGSRPTSVDEIRRAGMPAPVANDGATLQMKCDDDRCSPMALCLVLPADATSLSAARSAAARVKGYESGACGDPDALINSSVSITLSI